MKMRFYKEGGSEKHIRDITGILKISGDIIDRNYIDLWAKKLGVLHLWKDILTKLRG